MLGGIKACSETESTEDLDLKKTDAPTTLTRHGDDSEIVPIVNSRLSANLVRNNAELKMNPDRRTACARPISHLINAGLPAFFT